MTTTTTSTTLKRNSPDEESGGDEDGVNKKLKTRTAEHIIKELAKHIQEDTIAAFTAGAFKGVPIISCPTAPTFDSTYPWKEAEFDKLSNVGETAPYGKGEKTVIDTEVRNCKQLDADKFTITNKLEFQEALQKAVATFVQPHLAPSLPNIEIQLYKLLLYGKGSFFKPHQDTPRDERHFGSLVVVPPCKHTGGDLRVKHGNEEKVYNFSGSAKTRCHFVAFFTDCEHEITTLAKGFRVSLVYHLFRPVGTAPLPATVSISNNPIITLLRELKDSTDEDKPDEVAYLLEHKYPAVSLKPESLKGKDLTIYSLLAQFNPRVSGIEMRFTGGGSVDDERDFNIINEVVCDDYGTIEVDELDVHAKTQDKKIHPARLVFKVQKQNGKIDEIDGKARFLVDSELGNYIRHMRKVEAVISGTGNEGTTYGFRYMNGAIFINISGVENTDPFTVDHYNRELDVPDGP